MAPAATVRRATLIAFVALGATALLGDAEAKPSTRSGKREKPAHVDAAEPVHAPDDATKGDATKIDVDRPGKGAAERLGRAFHDYDRGDLDGAAAELAKIDPSRLVNRDYYQWLRGQVALLRGQPLQALPLFEALSRDKKSRFAARAAWRIADARWELGQRAAAAKAYAALIAGDGASRSGDLGTARFRIAQAAPSKAASIAGFRNFLLEHPGHPLADEAERQLIALGGEAGAAMSPTDRLARATNLTEAHLWDDAVAELALIPDDVPDDVKRRRDYWLGTTLFKMRRRYADAGRLLLAVAPQMGSSAAEAMFHGARALSRADHDDDAITWYRKVVAQFPSTAYAEEAQFLSGWLEFNRGRWADAVAPLTESLRRYPRSKWADDARWFLGLSHYFLGHWDAAIESFSAFNGRDALEAGKGRYWRARALQQKGDTAGATEAYRAVVGRWPFSWYALLARARLKELGVTIGPFGDTAPTPSGPPIADAPDPALRGHPLIASADELIRAGLGVEAGDELERGERAFLAKGDRARGFATLLDAYRRAGNFARPYELSVVYGSGALDGPPEGPARVWWEHAYPRAYRSLIEQWQSIGDNPDGYLYSIMRKESGFDPHVLSYADAQGLLQMIPATTARVAAALKLPYTAGDLYDPAFNIRTGAWYIGHLLAKFKGQIPLGAGSFNSGPRPVMRWLDASGDRPIDELVELVSYTQTREYMKKVTGNYARYRYLYGGEVYEQPLTVDRAYRVNDLTY